MEETGGDGAAAEVKAFSVTSVPVCSVCPALWAWISRLKAATASPAASPARRPKYMEKTDNALGSRGLRGNRQLQVVLGDWEGDTNRPLRFIGFSAHRIT